MKLIGDITHKSWNNIDESKSGYTLNIDVGFRDSGTLPVVFDSLSFGFSLSKSGKVLFSDSRPVSGAIILSTDQEVIDSFFVDGLYPDVDYVLNIWAENSGERWEQTFEVSVPRPSQPYPSYLWDELIHWWIPPVPYPDALGSYFWNEETLSWVSEQSLVEDSEINDAFSS